MAEEVSTRMRFSDRSNFEEKQNRLTALLQARQSAGACILDLTESNPARTGLTCPPALLAALAEPSSLQYRPDPAGAREARRAVAQYYAARNREAPVDSMFLTAGTSEAYSWIFRLLADPGQRLLVPRPSYPLLDHLAALESVTLDRYPLRYDGAWHLDLNDLQRRMSAETRAIVCINPNNPTGSFLSELEWQCLSEICNRSGTALIVDEVFSDFVLTPPHPCSPPLPLSPSPASPRSPAPPLRTAVGRHDCLNFVLSGLSKVLCLPQMKMGWIVIQGPAAARREACRRLELIADTFLSVNTPVQNAAAGWFGFREQIQSEVLARLRRNLTVLKGRVHESPCSLLNVEGGWYAVLQLPQVLTEEEWVLTLLEKDDVLVHPGYFFDFESEAFLVLSLLPEPALFEEAVRRIVQRAEAVSRERERGKAGELNH